MKKFVAIGHVDTGKSCLCGHLLYKCGYIDERNMNIIRGKAKEDKMEKWVWSRVLDIYEEEMEKGKTHEYNTVDFNWNNEKYQLIDTPGHQKFVRSMIEGISDDVNIAMLLISMKDNEFESSFERGMLKEHLVLARAVGIEHLIVVANKMDLIEWDEKECKKKVLKVIKYLVKELGWVKQNLHVVPITAFDGVGLVDKEGIPEWYKGKSLMETLNDIPYSIRDNNVVHDGVSENNTFIVDLDILNTNGSIISLGYICVIHYNGLECEIIVDAIGGNKPFLRKGTHSRCSFTTKQNIKIATGTKIILRKNDYTVGFGKIIG